MGSLLSFYKNTRIRDKKLSDDKPTAAPGLQSGICSLNLVPGSCGVSNGYFRGHAVPWSPSWAGGLLRMAHLLLPHFQTPLYVTFQTALGGGCYWPHFMDKNTETRQVAQSHPARSTGAEILTQAVWIWSLHLEGIPRAGEGRRECQPEYSKAPHRHPHPGHGKPLISASAQGGIRRKV